MKVRSLIFGLILFLGTSAFAQNVTVQAKLDSTVILMGEQTALRLQVSLPKGQPLQLPLQLGDTLGRGIEILAVSPPDTVKINEEIIQINQNYLITSFDSALYYINPMRVVVGRDTFRSNALALKVIGIPVDTTNIQLYDIKDVAAAPFVWLDWHYQILAILAVIAAILWGIYFAKRYKERKANQPIPERIKPTIPADQLALTQLEELKAEKLWQQDRTKEYYSRLTDIVRLYLEYQFDIDAIEMTSIDILEQVKHSVDLRSLSSEFDRLLETADLVKFAKYQTLPDDNERLWLLTKQIVETSTTALKERKTKEEEEAKAKEKKDEE